ncbi:hypothetical protein ES705_02763 [subsurface metagenome]|nr:MAG: hypothetical protein CEE42_08095 [Candidatus Lokiarchaeota archaeon Loki_b31]
MIYQFDFTENFLRPLAEFAGFFTLILGVMWLVYAVYETKRRGSVKKRKVEDWNFDITKFLKFLTYLGIVIGIFGLLSGVGGLILDQAPSVAYAANTQDAKSLFTSTFLIILGTLTLLKPLNDLPISSVIGILLASIVVVIASMAIPDHVVQVIAVYINPKVLLVIVFILVFAFVALTVKFYIGALMSISKAISWPIFAFIIAAFCILQGFLLLVIGVSITGYF